MPKYKLKLEVEIDCPVREGQPELTITPTEIRDALLRTRKGTNGYPVCSDANFSKLTATMHVTTVKFEVHKCEYYGWTAEVPL